MTKLYAIISVILLFSCSSFSQEEKKSNIETTTYFLIRHAEKHINNPSDKNPELTKEGVIRAEKWAAILADTKIDMVFSTNYKRTMQTAAPIAKRAKVEISSYNPQNLYAIDFQEKTKGKTCVIVGHSNTTPAFVNKILQQEKYPSISEKEYGKLFIIKIIDHKTTDTVLSIN